MSHAHGQVVINNEVVGYYEYNGTVDVAISHIYDTELEVNDNWRSDRWSDCRCGQPPIDALLYTNYGEGFHWKGAVCLRCRAIVRGLSPYDESDGAPIVITEGYPIPGREP